MRGMKAGALAVAGWLVAAGAMGGSITSVTAPATTPENVPVTITIQGTGSCSSVIVNYNTAYAGTFTYSVARFPYMPSPPHMYTATGMKTILVTATGNCTGRATRTINVTPPPPPPPPPASSGFVVLQSAQRLCAMISCTQTATTQLRPTLTEVTPTSVSPGQMLMISGYFLGSSPGIVRFRLQPFGGARQLANWTPFTVTSWTSFSVTVTLDERVSGFPDEDAQVVVQRADNVLSNAITVHFVAAREVVPVPRSLVTVSACGDDAVSRNCLASNDIQGTRYDWATFGAAAEPILPSDASASFSGFHQNYWDDGGCMGRDQFDLRLPQGWVIDSFAPGVRSTSNATFHASPPISGRRVGSVVVDWGLTGGDAHIFYGGWFYAAGPRGVPIGE
jgi:hypothetical protein